MELKGVGFPSHDGGDLQEMTTSIIEEYARIGWNSDRILSLFRNPHFRMTYTIYKQNGEEYVRELIEKVMLARPAP